MSMKRISPRDEGTVRAIEHALHKRGDVELEFTAADVLKLVKKRDLPIRIQDAVNTNQYVPLMILFLDAAVGISFESVRSPYIKFKVVQSWYEGDYWIAETDEVSGDV